MSDFSKRHIGPDDAEKASMLGKIGINSIDELINKTIPGHIRLNGELNISKAMSEQEYLKHITALGNKNKLFTSFIGLGYNETIVPSVILRNVLENPGWYTQYTPYQAEISQARLESLLNFQTMVADLTGLPVAGASVLDEATVDDLRDDTREREQRGIEHDPHFTVRRLGGDHLELVLDHVELLEGDGSAVGQDARASCTS